VAIPSFSRHKGCARILSSARVLRAALLIGPLLCTSATFAQTEQQRNDQQRNTRNSDSPNTSDQQQTQSQQQSDQQNNNQNRSNDNNSQNRDQTPPVQPLDVLRGTQDLARPPGGAFVPTGPSIPSTTDNPGLGDQIKRLGTSVPIEENPPGLVPGYPPNLLTRERPPNTPPPPPPPEQPPPPTTVENPIPHTPDQPPPPHIPKYPPPVITYRHDDNAPCCGMVGNRISYPITTDPMEVPDEPVAPRDPAVGAYQVLLANGAFFQNQQDFGVQALGFPIEWSRHWKGQVKFADGGFIGHGWDYAYNKRVVPIATKRYPNGLQFEEIGVDKAELIYYDGQVDAELDVEMDSEIRDIFNFDVDFQARVTTYKSPPGMFHEIERYILIGESPHPFEHPNVEKTEKIFYVMREKNGTRYVFNCRGQLIYILSRNDSKEHHVRVELDYNGPLNPLSQNRMLSKIIDASGHIFMVDWQVNIHDGLIHTNINCGLVDGKYPIPRLSGISGAGFWVEYNYRNGNTEPLLESAILHTDVDQRWEYKYDVGNRLTEQKNPNECAKGTNGKPYLVNTYQGDRVKAQQMAGYTTTLGYGGKVTVTDPDKAIKEYVLESIDDYKVVKSITVKDTKEGPFTTNYQHNGDTQVTRITNPKGNGIAYTYSTDNSAVTLGPVRDKKPDITYAHDLGVGNLLSATLFGYDGKTDGKDAITSHQSYERLYNQTDEAYDALNNVTKKTYLYDRPGDRGNPHTIQGPPVLQPDSSSVPAAISTFTYNEFGQPESEDRGGGHVTSFKYNPRHYLNRTEYAGGGFDTFTPSDRGELMEQGGSSGTVVYGRNERGLVTSKQVGPYNLHVLTSYEYDLDNNINKTTLHIEDVFPTAVKYGIYELDKTDRVVRTEYDILDRKTSDTIEADGKKLATTYKYTPGGHVSEVHAPPLAAKGEFKTTYKYNARGLITEETQAAGTPAAYTSKNTYNENSNLVHVEDVGNKLSSAQDMVYDEFDRLVGVNTGIGTDEVYEYDKLRNLTHAAISGFNGKGDAKELLSQTDYKYDAYKHQISEKRDTLNSGILEKQQSYDAYLHLRRQKNPNGSESTFDYNLAGHLTDTKDSLGNLTHNVYDDAGNLKRVEETTTEQAFDNGAGKFNPKQATYATTNTYDAVGRLTDIESSSDTVHMFYDSAGEVRGIASTAQGVTINRYDGFGRRTQVARSGATTKTQYTPGGLAADVNSPTAHDTFTYDAMGHTTSHTNELAGKTSRAAFVYDGLGRQKSAIDANGTVITRTFNDAGQPLTVSIEASPAAVGATAVRANNHVVPAVSGVRLETYTYDGLGRVLTAETEQDSKVELTYDGIGRVLSETQTIGSVSQTVKHEYAANGKYEDVIYPDLAGSGRVRHSYDDLGRTAEVTLNGKPIANYIYTGTDRIAQRQAGNFVSSRFTYDGRRRLTRIAASDLSGSTKAGDTLWSQTVNAYREGLPQTIQEVAQATDGAPARVITTTLGYDADGRTMSSSTKIATAAGADTSIADSSSYSEFENGRLKRMAEYSRDDLGGTIQTARTDEFTYTPDGRVDVLATQGILKAKSESAPTDIDDVQKHIDAAGSDKISSEQKFTYDWKGNLLFDGRFAYTYDFMNRLVGVEDTYSPFRYTESIRFTYDAFGRRIKVEPRRDRDSDTQGFLRWGGVWEKTLQYFFYDGDHLIEEVLPLPPKPATGTVLLARYFFGAKPDERLRMDRRPENDLSARLQTFYLQEDVQGSYRLLTDEDGKPAFVENREPAPGTADAAPGRPPGDENYIVGTEIRFPYFNAATRIDGFAGTVYSESAKSQIYNYRSAYKFARGVDYAFLKASIAQQQNRLLAVFGTMAAAPLIAPVAATGAAAMGAAGVAKAAIAGGLINVGLGYGQAAYFHDEYGASQALKEFGTGAAMGVSGGALAELELGFWTTRALDFGINAGGGTVWDVGVNDMALGDALENNLSSAAIGAALGTATGYLAHSNSAAKLTEAAEEIEASASAVEQVPATKQASPAVAAAKSHPAATPTGTRARMRTRFLGDVQSESEALFDQQIITDLALGGEYPAEILRRIESGEARVVFREFGATESIMFKDPDAANWLGYYSNRDPWVLHINTKHIQLDQATGRWSTRVAASVIVHEGVHYLGLGEISAHIAQAQFLLKRYWGNIWNLDPTMPVTIHHMPGGEPLLEMVNAFASGNYGKIMAYLIRAQYEDLTFRHKYGVDSFVDAVPLRTGMPSIDRYLAPRADGSRL
jgi:YD repeat-containing protein